MKTDAFITQKHIETILIGALFGDQEKDQLLISAFLSSLTLALNGDDTFSLVPDEVYVPIEKFIEIEKIVASKVGLAKDFITGTTIENNHRIQYFKEEGILLFDGLHASAFGKMNYIYRAKGIRIYFFKNSEIKIVTPYCTIDHDGFQLKQEEVASYPLSQIKTRNDIVEILNYTRNDFTNPFNNSLGIQNLIKLLTNIKRNFHRDYYLEYLLTPPDVDVMSTFSKNIRTELWSVCLSKQFLETWGQELQDQAINLLSTLKLSPSPEQLINFIRSNSEDIDTVKILNQLSRLENNLIEVINTSQDKKEPIFEFKPNFNGIGINGNEALKRLKKIWRNKKK